MTWVFVLAGIVVFLAVVEWTSTPRRKEKDGATATPPPAYIRVPHPRTPARDTSASDTTKP